MRRFSISTAVVAIAALAMPAVAQSQSLEPVDTYFFSLGAYRAGNDVKFNWEPSTGSTPGSRIDLDRDLGIDLDATEGVFKAGASFGRGERGHRHKFEVFRYGYDDSASMVLKDEYRIGDEVFAEGADFEGDFEVKLLGASYTWFFHHGDRSAFGVGIGAIRYDVSAAFAASVEVDGQLEAASAAFSESDWVPQVHAEYARSLSAHWRVGADASFVKKSGGPVSGRAIDYGVKVDYFPWQHVGFSLRYNYNDIDLDFDRRRFTGGVDIKTHGPQLSAILRF